MKRTTMALILILLLSTLAGAMLTNLVWGNFGPMTPPELPTPIYIREDGSIEGGAGALKRTGNVYTFLRDINETVEIQKDNITLYGNGFKLKRPPEVEMQDFWSGGAGWYPSILISTRKNVTIQNIECDACHTCIKVENSSKITIVQNKMYNANTGVYMIYCTDSSIIGNEILNSSGTGLFIPFSSHLNIAYNSISGTGWNGAWVSISDSTITRNDFTNNTNIGLYLYGDNKNNRIFENNFMDNDEGLCFMNTGGGFCFKNTLMNNYWSNRRVEIVNADEFNSVDPAPLASPVSTSFDPSLFNLPSLTPTASPSPHSESNSEPYTTTLVIASVITVAIVGTGLLVYFKKRKR